MTCSFELRALAGAVPMAELAARYGISKAHAYGIVARETWRHI